ncbi:hypothetical protein ACFFMN_25505 [Planobispora siamensis]|uniref:Uncharacterized protein n=1 Tax=Planobispora siamensis TaxID=936338 RepID=A0A8J3WLR1_9ACTN|nr:hypothetical protein [Planobispora siamensis]GIH94143.1 hypothetical protein Psi01_47730 [Planobispora siamensis]
MSEGIFREEPLRRHQNSARRGRTRLTIGTGTLVALWTAVVLLVAAGAVFVAALHARIGGVG